MQGNLLYILAVWDWKVNDPKVIWRSASFAQRPDEMEPLSFQPELQWSSPENSVSSPLSLICPLWRHKSLILKTEHYSDAFSSCFVSVCWLLGVQVPKLWQIRFCKMKTLLGIWNIDRNEVARTNRRIHVEHWGHSDFSDWSVELVFWRKL